MNPRRALSALFLPALVLAGPAAWSAQRSVPLVNYEKQTWLRGDGKALSLEAIRSAIIRGGAHRGWNAQPAGEGALLLDIEVREHKATVEVSFTASEFSIRYKDSTKLGYEKKGSEELIHPNYNRWVDYLRKDIKSELVAN